MKHGTQIQLAEWVERLRNDPSASWPMADWMEEQNIKGHKQVREACKYLLVAHSSLNTQHLKKFTGITTYFTKFKQIRITQKGFSFKIQIEERDKYWTNKRIKMNPCYRNLLK